MSAQSAKIEAGHVWLPTQAPWLEELRLELLQFPKGKHDDQVDSISQFLIWMEQHSRSGCTIEELLL
jgi:predicted phage terminase large subunit-like protein